MKTKLFFLLSLSIYLSLSSQITKQALTRVTYNLLPQNELDEEYFYTYNNDGNQTEAIEYYYSSPNVIDSGSRTTFAYDTNTGNLIEAIIYDYNTSTSTWNYSRKHTMPQYDTNGNVLEQYTYLYNNSQNVWEAFSRNYYTYDTNGKLTMITKERYQPGAQNWESSSKIIYSYDSNSGLNTKLLMMLWNSSTNSFVNDYKTTFTYNANNDVTLVVEYEYNTSSQWEEEYKTEYEYDSNTQNLLSFAFYYKTFNNWYGENKAVMVYDTYGNAETINIYDFDSSTNDWYSYPSTVGQTTYNNNYNEDDLIVQSFFEGLFPFLFNHQLEELLISDYDSNTSTLTPEGRYNYYYTGMNISGVDNKLLSKNIKVYPNPVKDFINIQGTEKLTDYKIIVYDMQGKQIMVRKGLKKINIQLLPTGKYIYKIVAKEGIKSGILIKN